MQLEGVREEIHRLPKPSKDKKPPFKNNPGTFTALVRFACGCEQQA
jgi:hypothetical protein